MMEVLSGKYGFSVDRVDEFKENGDHVSSSAIRRLLESGIVSLAGRYLGRNYSLSGKVVEEVNSEESWEYQLQTLSRILNSN